MSREEEVRKEAKKIMDEFIKALEKMKEIKGEVGFESKQDTRDSKKRERDENFKKRFLANAPKKTDDFIVAEKKRW